jgi:DNA-binding transcriptional MerR regulator
VRSPAHYLNPSQAAKRLGVSAKALRLYEERGLIAPLRTAAGWRTYGPAEMARAETIVALRSLGLSVAQVKRVLIGEATDLLPALANHQALLEGQAREINAAIQKVRALRTGLEAGDIPGHEELAGLVGRSAEPRLAFDLPWPWGGERFELFEIRPINYIIGPLGSGKTRLARAIAETLPNAAFIGLERLEDNCSYALAQVAADPSLKARVDESIGWLEDEGANISPALTALLVALETSGEAIPVIDMIEQGLDQTSQEALAAYLRRRQVNALPLFAMTRSSSILDLDCMTSNETIIFCPANHNPPITVAPYPGAPGYEAVAMCLAPPEVRARTEGVIAWRPEVRI